MCELLVQGEADGLNRNVGGTGGLQEGSADEGRVRFIDSTEGRGGEGVCGSAHLRMRAGT